MTLEEARNHLAQQIELSSGYSRNSIQMLLSEVVRSHGEASAMQLIEEFNLTERFQISRDTLIRF